MTQGNDDDSGRGNEHRGPGSDQGGRDTGRPPGHGKRMRESARRVVREMSHPGPGLVHPALIPGVGVEKTKFEFGTNRLVFAISGLLILGVIAWAIAAPDSIPRVGADALGWINVNFGWLFRLLAVVVLLFMIVLGYGRCGGVRLGADNEKPEFSTVSWVAMLFSAGMGIGLLFYGPYEPLVYFNEPPHGFNVQPGSVDAAQAAMAQTILHWGLIPWAFYALVGGAIAYSAYRRGRRPLISAIFEPLFGTRVQGPLGAVIDIFAIIVTLFGTAVSLGIGALQIAQGVEIVSGIGPIGNKVIVGIMAILTAAFIISAVSGVSRGIRILSNTNMVVAGSIAIFVFVAGPTIFLLNLLPSSFLAFFRNSLMMLARNPDQGEGVAKFLSSWTVYYWAWWISWTPFVGMFIAKISRGRTLREFVTVVIVVPAVVCSIWFLIFGGASMFQDLSGLGLSESGSAEAMLFDMLRNLPFGTVTTILAMVSILVFFVTSADSASIVMSSMSQRGEPEPSPRVTITWGLLLGATAASLLLAGGENALSGLQSIMVVSALPFAVILIGMMASWAKELHTDPYLLRRHYAQSAIAQGVRLGIAKHGDNFVFGASEVAADEGAGGWLDSEDPKLTAWYVDVMKDEADILSADDVRRTLSPGRIQPKGPPRPDLSASGDESTATRVRHRNGRPPTPPKADT